MEVKITADVADKKKVNTFLAAMIWVAAWAAINYFCGLGLSTWWLLEPFWMAPVGAMFAIGGIGYLMFIRDVVEVVIFRWFRK